MRCRRLKGGSVFLSPPPPPPRSLFALLLSKCELSSFLSVGPFNPTLPHWTSFAWSAIQRKMTKGLDFQALIILFACVLCYLNSLRCGFVFDDMSAVKNNKDLRPHTSLSNLFWNDFWGTPMHKEQSHKSYRPFCVLTFRWNYALHELDPMGYHLVNVILHGVVGIMFLRLCNNFLTETGSFVAALLFAVHPIHTEAVTGVVGRAEILSSLFFIKALNCYIHCSGQRRCIDWRSLLLTGLYATIAMLCKEQGITVVAVCCLYEIFVAQKLRVQDLFNVQQGSIWSKAAPSGIREMFIRLFFLVASSLCLLLLRVKIMGAQLPVFTRFDNPASVTATPTRQLTYSFLATLNMWLLFYPCDLCCDWTMGTIPLVNSFLDPRNLTTLVFYGSLVTLGYYAFTNHNRHTKIISISLALIIFPFLPASNLFFPVGFVIAERILYTPSMGFCLLVAHGWSLLADKSKILKKILWACLVLIIIIQATKTIIRNFDWESEYTIFMAGLRVNNRNAKLFNNVGHALESQGKFYEALEYFHKAVAVQPDDIGAHINVGRTFYNLRQYKEAEIAYMKAKDLLPKPKPGDIYQARIAPNHLNVFLNLANLMSKNETRLEEADALYRQAISMRSDYTQAYINRGDVLIKLNRTKEAQEVYEKALQYDSSNPDIYYNLGVVFLEQGKSTQALAYLNKALEFDPDHKQALMNSAILIQESGNPQLRRTAYDRLFKLLKKDTRNERIYFNLGMLAMDDKEFSRAEKWFKMAVLLKQDFRSALFNLALLLSDARRPLEAAPYLNQLLKYHPDHIKGLILLGDIYINYIKDLPSAEKCYRKLLEIEPTNVQGAHNLCVVFVERGELEKAEECLLKAHSISPNEDYILRHLRIVKARIQRQKLQVGQQQQQAQDIFTSNTHRSNSPSYESENPHNNS